MSTPVSDSLVPGSRCAGILLSLILVTTVGCKDRDPDYHFPQREALGMSRDELFQKLLSHQRGLGDKRALDRLTIDFILEDGQRVPYLSPNKISILVGRKRLTHARLRDLGYEDGKDLPRAYCDSRVWYWSPTYGAAQGYEYIFDDNDRVAKITVLYFDEGAGIGQLFTGFYWLGSVFSAGALLYTYRRGKQRRPAGVPWNTSARFYLELLKECGIALLAGMVAITLTAAVVDAETVLGMCLMILPLSASMVLYYGVLVFSRSRSLSLCAFFVLPICAAALVLVEILTQSQTFTGG